MYGANTVYICVHKASLTHFLTEDGGAFTQELRYRSALGGEDIVGDLDRQVS